MVVSSQFIDESLDLNNCHNYTLSIQLALDGFSFSVFDKTINKFIALAVYEVNAATAFELKNELLQIFNENAVLTASYANVNVMFIQKNEFIAPTLLFDYNDQFLLNNFLNERNFGEDLISRPMKKNSITATSSIPVLIKEYLLEKHPNCNFFPPSIALFNFLPQHKSLQLVVSRFSHVLTIIGVEHEKVEFFNNFYVKNDNDLLYYLFNVAKQLGTTSKTEIYLMGNISSNSSTYNQLNKYFEKLIFPTYPQKYAVSYTILKEPHHQYIPLLELALCE